LAYTNPPPTPSYSKSPPKPARRSYIPHPREYASVGEGPFWGSVASVIGGSLVLLQGVLVGLYGSGLGWWATALFSFPPADEGWLMVLTGAGIAGFGWLAFHAPGNHRVDGAMIWLLLLGCGLTSWVLGFYVGSIVAAIGAAHIFWWTPTQVGGAEGIRRAIGFP
jgi:hypothetical protein